MKLKTFIVAALITLACGTSRGDSFTLTVLFPPTTGAALLQGQLLTYATNYFNATLVKSPWGSNTYNLTINSLNPNYVPPTNAPPVVISTPPAPVDCAASISSNAVALSNLAATFNNQNTTLAGLLTALNNLSLTLNTQSTTFNTLSTKMGTQSAAIDSSTTNQSLMLNGLGSTLGAQSAMLTASLSTLSNEANYLVQISTYDFVLGWAFGVEHERNQDVNYLINYATLCSSPTAFGGSSTKTWSTPTCSSVTMQAANDIYSLSFSTPTPIPGF